MEPGLSILYPKDPATSITTIPSSFLTLEYLSNSIIPNTN
jgi:hypothetical protein